MKRTSVLQAGPNLYGQRNALLKLFHFIDYLSPLYKAGCGRRHNHKGCWIARSFPYYWRVLEYYKHISYCNYTSVNGGPESGSECVKENAWYWPAFHSSPGFLFSYRRNAAGVFYSPSPVNMSCLGELNRCTSPTGWIVNKQAVVVNLAPLLIHLRRHHLCRVILASSLRKLIRDLFIINGCTLHGNIIRLLACLT